MSEWDVVEKHSSMTLDLCVCRLQADDLHRDLSGGGAGGDGSDLLPAGQIIT